MTSDSKEKEIASGGSQSTNPRQFNKIDEVEPEPEVGSSQMKEAEVEDLWDFFTHPVSNAFILQASNLKYA